MTKTVIFDLDGLLVDSEMMGYEICRHFIEQQGGTLSVKDYAPKMLDLKLGLSDKIIIL